MHVTDRLHLPTRHREQLEALFREHLPDVEVWAYGSRVAGRSHGGSDLDLVLRGPGLEEIDLARLDDFQQALQGSTMPFLVEARDWARLPARFHREIEREYVVFVRGDRSLVGDGKWLADRFERANGLETGFEPASTAGAWREVRLGDVVRLASGGTPSKRRAAYWDGEIPWVSARDMKRFRLRDTGLHLTAEGLANGTRQVPTGTLLLLTRGMRLLKELPVCVTERPMAFNQDVKALLPKARVDPGFLPYLVVGNRSGLLNLVDLAGHGTGRINSDELRAFRVRLPPTSEQRAIAHILGTLDEKIELNRRMNETLEAMARALFESWFVDFDPVRAKMEGRDTGLPEDIADLFASRLVDSEIGPLPDGWRLGTFGAIAEEVREPVHPLKHPDLVFRHFSFGAFDNGREPVLQPGREIRSQKFRVPSGTVLVSRLNPETERVWLVGEGAGESSVCSTEFLVSRPRPPFGPNFLYCQTLSCGFRDGLRGLATGTSKSHQRARPGAVLNLPVVLPSPALVSRWEEAAEGILSRANRCRRESAELAWLRDALLPTLVSGTVRIPDARWVPVSDAGTSPLDGQDI